MSVPQYKVLIIGCGNIAGGFDVARAPVWPLTHAGAYQQHGGFRLLACVDPDDEKRTQFARRWGMELSARDVEGLKVAPGTFDVISICSPTSHHHEHIGLAMKLRPRAIFCEKPLAPEVSMASAMVEACESEGVTLLVNYNRRWDPSIAAMIQDLRSGARGAIRSVVAHYNKGILNNGGHMLDLLQQLLGPMELVAAACPYLDFWDADPTVAALLTALKGAVPVYLNPANARDYAFFELEIITSLGTIRMQQGGLSWEFRSAKPSNQFSGYYTLGSATHEYGRYPESMCLAVEDIFNHLRTGSAVRSTGADALKVQILCQRIRNAAMDTDTVSYPYKGN